ncbi:MAG TPA: hypothetical protein VIK78_06265 [Ruminiclostridium sp.]
MKQTKRCGNCERGLALHLTKDILCNYHGVVTPDYVCFKYKDVSESSSTKQVNFKCIHCEYFLVRLDSPNEEVGQCKLFSARDFNGTTRNVCSKFSKKLLIEVC